MMREDVTVEVISNPHKEVVIFEYVSHNNPTPALDDAVTKYVDGRPYKMFRPYALDNPWYRLIVLDKP